MIENLENEEWRYVVGYEENYMISNKGRIKSNGFDTIASNGKRHIAKAGLLKPHTNKFGYVGLTICRNKIPKRFLIHRLVALAFIPNPENKPQVNHINGIKNDNRVENLEWCTFSENIQHAYKILKRKGSMQGNLNREDRSIPVVKLINEEVIEEYPSAAEAARQNNICHRTCIFRAIKKKQKSGGFHWNYKINFQEERKENLKTNKNYEKN